VIVDLIVGALFGLLNAVLGVIPTFDPFEQFWSDGSGYDGTVTQLVAGFLAIWDRFVPIELCFLAFFAIVAAKVFVAVAQFVMTLWQSLPFKSS
jgi:hypothetical protein